MGDAIAGDRLRSLVERIERLEAEKADLAEDIKQIYAEAKGAGFNTKALRQIIRQRGKEDREVQEFAAILDIYRNLLGMGPLFDLVPEGRMHVSVKPGAAPAGLEAEAVGSA